LERKKYDLVEIKIKTFFILEETMHAYALFADNTLQASTRIFSVKRSFVFLLNNKFNLNKTI